MNTPVSNSDEMTVDPERGVWIRDHKWSPLSHPVTPQYIPNMRYHVMGIYPLVIHVCRYILVIV